MRLIITATIAITLLAAASCAQRGAAPVAGPREEQRIAAEIEPIFASAEVSEPATSADSVPLPAGHPDISEMMQRQSNAGQTEQGLPAGHPDIAELMQRQAQSGLPAGHPDISEMMQRQAAGGGQPLPPGHPEIPQKPAAETKPAGHAPGDGCCPEEPAAAQTTPAPAPAPQAVHAAGDACCPTDDPAAALAMAADILATINVQVIQGSAGGPAISEGTVTLEIHQAHQAAKTLELKLDASGRASATELPAPASFQPVIKMTYEGVEYETIGRAMGAGAPMQDLELVVYQTTEEKPNWTIGMRHVIAEAYDGRLHVSETVVLNNPGDRAWVGRPIADGRSVSFELPLPAGAEHVQMTGGYHACCVREHEGRLVNTMAMLPGAHQYQYTYTLPIQDRRAEVTVSAVAPTRQLAVFIPEDQAKYTLAGLTDAGTRQMGQVPVRYFAASNVPAEQVLTLSLSEIVMPQAAAAASGNSHNNAKMFAGGGALLILVLGGLILFAKGGKKAAAK